MMTTELQAAAAEIAEREDAIKCTSLSAEQMRDENTQEDGQLKQWSDAVEALADCLSSDKPDWWAREIVSALKKRGFTIIHTSKLEAECAKVKKLREFLKAANYTYLGGEYVCCIKPSVVDVVLAETAGDVSPKAG